MVDIVGGNDRKRGFIRASTCQNPAPGRALGVVVLAILFGPWIDRWTVAIRILPLAGN
jgi:hypothetical protein